MDEDKKTDAIQGSQNVPLETNFEFIPQNPYTLSNPIPGGGESEAFKGDINLPSFSKTFGAEAYAFNITAQAAHAGYEKFESPNPLDDTHSPDWTPTSNPEVFQNVRPEKLAYLMEATGPKDQQYRLQRIMAEQDHDDALANGSTLAKILGGATGLVTDPMSYVPIIGWAKYAKFGTTAIKSIARSLPGVTAYSAAKNAAEQTDKVTGNLPDFLTNTMVDTAFGSALFGVLGTGALSLDKMELWNLRKIATASIDGVDFKLATNEKGELTGIKAFEKPGSSVGAAKVSMAQELADSSFHKSGLFKIPIIGDGAIKLLSMPPSNNPFINIITTPLQWIGTPALRMLNSPFKTVRAFIDRAQDHNIITEGVAKGETSTIKFSSLMQQQYSSIRALQAQMNALHLERNGFDIKNRALGGIVNVGLGLKNATLKTISRDTSKSEFVSKEDFHSEVENVLRNEVPSEHSPVNEAAGIIRKKLDETYLAYRQSHGLPEDWLPPKTSEGYLMRVYDTPYMNTHENEWISAVSNSLKEGDEFINSRLQPIKDMEELGKSNPDAKMKAKAMKDSLQNELRKNPDLYIHVHEWNDLSADEAKELQGLLKPIEDAKKISKEDAIKAEEDLQQRIHNGEINKRLYTKIPGSQRYELKDPNKRLRFRDTYESDYHRQLAAKAYYDTILNQTAQQTISQLMGRVLGVSKENSLKSRTLIIPDEVLYNGNFMSKDLMSKVSNYVTYLSRRTNLKKAYGDLSDEEGIEPLFANLSNEHEEMRAPLNKKLADLKNKPNSSKQIAKVEKQLSDIRKQFDKAIKDMRHVYEKMMGLKQTSREARKAQSAIMSLSSIATLPFVPLTMINDLGNIGLQHGVWPFIRDGIYPVIQSLAGILKTKDSAALRKAAPSVHLALQDQLTGYADKNWSMHTEPYINMGKIVNNLEHLSHFSANITGTNYFENGLQRMAASTAQSEFMRIMFAAQKGTITSKEALSMRKYGIDPNKSYKKFIEAYKEGGGYKTSLGGHQSNFWEWKDLEASKEFGDAVFRATKDAVIQRDLADAPFWADNPLGAIAFGFQGWTFASINRFVVPTMQQPDLNKMMGVLLSLATGALVDPMRRIAKGEDPIPDDMTDDQFMFAAFQNAGLFSWFSNVLNDANVLSGDRILGDLKNDRYKDRTRVGLLGPAWGTINRMGDVFGSIASGEFNKADAKKLARMIPIANASWGYLMSKSLIDRLNIPETRAQAHALKNE